ncbi:hypothetical protein [Streptomyces sp. URMC 123]|uniref:hypothetical protein n=1 Tax=Streptomyces sp. URMC 123 TaxID=3423403 RepID=UPI003F1C6AD6
MFDRSRASNAEERRLRMASSRVHYDAEIANAFLRGVRHSTVYITMCLAALLALPFPVIWIALGRVTLPGAVSATLACGAAYLAWIARRRGSTRLAWWALGVDAGCVALLAVFTG